MHFNALSYQSCFYQDMIDFSPPHPTLSTFSRKILASIWSSVDFNSKLQRHKVQLYRFNCRIRDLFSKTIHRYISYAFQGDNER